MPTTSMTGFGSASAENNEVSIDVEVRSVNHRFLDVSCKLPSVYLRFERDLAGVIKEHIKRGRVDVYVNRTDSRSEYDVAINESLFSSHWNIVEAGLKAAGVKGSSAGLPAVLHVLGRRDVVEVHPPEFEEEMEKAQLFAAAKLAAEGLAQMREREGEALAAEIRSLLTSLEATLSSITGFVETTAGSFHKRLSERLEKLNPNLELDPDRLALEVALLADRTDVTEELARLGSHLAQFKEILGEAGNGRKLEFLLQEMGREINTCGAKAQNSDVQAHVVEAKAALEKIREQVLNIE